MDDQDLRSALRGHDGLERRMRVDERARIMARLQAQQTELHEPTAVEPVSETGPIIDITPAPSTTDRRRPPIWMAAAAAVLVLAGLFFLVGRGEYDGDVEVVADVDEPTPAPIPSPTPVPTCPAAITDFIVAVDAWDGIETWASLVDDRRPEPDLPTLGAAAVMQWSALAAADPLLVGLEIEVDEPPADISELAGDAIVRRSAPLQAAFDRMRLASRDLSSVLAPCAEQIEIVVVELGLPEVVADGG